MIRAAIAQAILVVSGWFTWAPITSRRLVSRTSGISAKGMPKDSTTWLRTSALVGLTPRASTTRAGIIVTRRRTYREIRSLTKPDMTTWPA